MVDPNQDTNSPLLPTQGSNFVILELVREPAGFRYRPTARATLFVSVFRALGFAVLLAGAVTLLHAPPVGLVAIAAGVAFLGIATRVTRGLYAGARFDQRRRRIELPLRAGTPFGWFAPPAWRVLDFARVARVQIVAKSFEDADGPDYVSHEINLVLHDGTRLNLVSHPDDVRARREAAEIANLLGLC